MSKDLKGEDYHHKQMMKQEDICVDENAYAQSGTVFMTRTVTRCMQPFMLYYCQRAHKNRGIKKEQRTDARAQEVTRQCKVCNKRTIKNR